MLQSRQSLPDNDSCNRSRYHSKPYSCYKAYKYTTSFILLCLIGLFIVRKGFQWNIKFKIVISTTSPKYTFIHNLRKNNCGILRSQVRKCSHFKLLRFIVCLKNQIWAISNRKYIRIKFLIIRFFCFKIRLIPSSCIMDFILKIRIELRMICNFGIIRKEVFYKELVFLIKILKNLLRRNTAFQQSMFINSYSCWSFKPSWDGKLFDDFNLIKLQFCESKSYENK